MTAKLEELDALVKAATPGPWDYVDSVVWIATHDSHGEPVQQKVADTGDEADAALIVWLVNNAPAMLRAQAEDNARLREKLGHLLSIDSQHDRTPRIIDIAYTAFMRAKDANDEDGGATDWMTDTRPLVLEAIAQHRAALGSPPDA